jgi:hypothetical protein
MELITALINQTQGARSGWKESHTWYEFYNEFYKKFWGRLGPLLLRVANTNIQEEKLIPSMLNGVITLVPTKRRP